MLVVMCSDPFETRRVDEDWAAERAVALARGLRVELVHWESVVAGEGDEAVRRVSARSEPERALYRGWMLTPDQYRLLFEALRGRGVELITSPERYAWAHTLPGWYASFEGLTPRSRWLAAGDPLDEAFALARELLASCPGGIVVKDYVKSRKHEWFEACFIPDADALERVIQTFVERQGEIVGGLVFREYVQLESLGPHPRSGMPMSVEFRMFRFEGRTIATMPYWPEQAIEVELPDLRSVALERALASVGPGLVSVDLALSAAGSWIVIEVGDGQVSGLPRPADAEPFYAALASAS